MKNWRHFKLSELYEISSGLSKPAEEFGFGSPFLSFTIVFNNYFLPHDLTQLVNSSKKEQEVCSIQKGDVFLTRTSEVIEELGMSSVALRDYPTATFNGFTKRLRPKSHEYVDPKFMGYYLRSPHFRAEVTGYSSLTTRASLNNGIIERLNVYLPPLHIQQKIASILSAYDELIENNKQRIKLLEEMAEEIYKEWFVRFRFPGYESTRFFYEKGKEVPHGTPGALPEGWENQTINSIINIVSGYAFKSETFNSAGVFKLVTIKNVQDGYFVTDTTDFIEELPKNLRDDYRLKDKDIILSLTGNIGRACLVYGDNYLLNQRVAKLKPKQECYFEFVYLLFRSKKMRSTLENVANGAAQQNLSPIEMGELEVAIPTHDMLESFSSLTQAFFDQVIALYKQNQILQQTRDLLLPRLISGKLSVEKLVEHEVERLSLAAEPFYSK